MKEIEKKILNKLDEAINAPTHESCKKILIDFKKEFENSNNDDQRLKVVLKIIEFLNVAAKIITSIDN